MPRLLSAAPVDAGTLDAGPPGSCGVPRAAASFIHTSPRSPPTRLCATSSPCPTATTCTARPSAVVPSASKSANGTTSVSASGSTTRASRTARSSCSSMARASSMLGALSSATVPREGLGVSRRRPSSEVCYFAVVLSYGDLTLVYFHVGNEESFATPVDTNAYFSDFSVAITEKL